MKNLIKKFSLLTGVDKETLRFYRDKGLLEPERDPGNGYTYYSESDFLDLYSILKYRDMEMSVSQTKEILRGKNLHLYETGMDLQIRELREEIVTLQRKLFRIENARRYLSMARTQNKQILYQEDGIALYTKWLSAQEERTCKNLLTEIPGSYIGINIPLEELKNGPSGDFYSSCIGVGISEPSVKEYGFEHTEGMEYTSGGPVLKYYLRLEDPMRIRREDMEELIRYGRENGYEWIDHTTGYLCGTERREGKRYYYFLIRVRVKKQ